jgi:hypothetical protein
MGLSNLKYASGNIQHRSLPSALSGGKPRLSSNLAKQRVVGSSGELAQLGPVVNFSCQ